MSSLKTHSQVKAVTYENSSNSVWKKVNQTLKKQIPVNSIYHIYNDNGSKWYYIEDMNRNHTNFYRGGFYHENPAHNSWFINFHIHDSVYIVDCEKWLYAKLSDLLKAGV